MNTTGIDRLGFLVHDAARLIRKRFEQRASEYGLSAAQWRLLFRLGKEPGVAQARLAELLEIEPISVSRLLDRMEEGGWIERRQDASDRRVRMVFPTLKARETYGYVRSLAGEVYEEALAGVPDETRKALIEALEGISRNLSDGESCGVTAETADMRKAG